MDDFYLCRIIFIYHLSIICLFFFIFLFLSSDCIPLQGHIALDQAVFPENTPGFVLDAFARSSLWKIGLDYRHGIQELLLAYRSAEKIHRDGFMTQ